MADTMRTLDLTDEQISLIRDTLQDQAEIVTDDDLAKRLLALASQIEGLDDGDGTLHIHAPGIGLDRLVKMLAGVPGAVEDIRAEYGDAAAAEVQSVLDAP